MEKSDINCIKFVDTPSQLPTNIDFCIYGTDARSVALCNILSIATPNSRFVGFCENINDFEAGDAGRRLIVIDPDYPNSIKGLSREALSRVIVMPIPEDDPWGYWDILSKYQYLVEGSARGGAMPGLNVHKLAVAFRNGQQYSLEGNTFFYEPALFLSHFRPYFDASHQKLAFIYNNLSDQQSIYTLTGLVSGGYLDNFRRFFNNMFAKMQYCDHVQLSAGDTIINCGLHTGYELPFFINKLRARGCIYNVDPMGEAFLSDYARRYVDNFRDVVVTHEIAVANYDGEIKLNVAADGQAYAGGTDAVRVFPCLRLKTFIDTAGLSKVDLMKFDLEGAEVHLLSDIIEVAKQYRPQIAISIYHEVTHFIDIPTALMAGLENYNYYITSYGFERFEVILYCIPVERDSGQPNGVRLLL